MNPYFRSDLLAVFCTGGRPEFRASIGGKSDLYAGKLHMNITVNSHGMDGFNWLLLSSHLTAIPYKSECMFSYRS